MASIDIPLKGKILLITGGASGRNLPPKVSLSYHETYITPGIGLSLVRQAHDLGARILVADLRTTPEFDAFSAGKDNILYIQSDVTNWSDFNKIFDACEKKWNDVPDAYGISAGLFDPPYSSFWLDTEEESYKQVEVNVNHPMKLTRLAMKKSLGRGKRASVCIIVRVSLFLYDTHTSNNIPVVRRWSGRQRGRSHLLRNQTRHGRLCQVTQGF